ncbi:hypothetical protein DPMN_080710 [Dreissena polymorpha]|uniref:EGF-like domain-containing protein n=1 Tax=Dreissena polymorpha TaxID=45954 RepID=A0A9D4BRZ5_DREPO|nr:hypothetical protein DPMN_080710 [Dreissena polymorpha]
MDCSANCSEGCVDKVCRRHDAMCTRGCKQGYSGEHCCLPGIFGWSCELQCPINCNTCTSMNYCQSCKDGLYGSTCKETCPVNCKTCISQRYCTECKNGYTGTTCHIHCPENCLTCNNVGKCVRCKDGFSRPDTECQCLNTMCASSECMSCANSTYYADGSSCCPCNNNCKHGSCIAADQCTYGCEDGLFGPKCEFQCTQIDTKCSVCIGNNIKSSVCNTCTNGYYPDTNHTCVQCSKLCVEGHCNGNYGHCKKGCTDGYWNTMCDRSCIEKCTVCNQNSGDCLTCSSTDVFGAKCDVPCSNTCINASCHMNGTCKSGCISDYYGPSCKQCPTNCARRDNGTRCLRATGLCLYGCNEGFEGEGCVEGENSYH